MVLLTTISSKVNQWLGPFLLRHGLNLRKALRNNGIIRDEALDQLTLLPLAMKLIALESRDEGDRAVVASAASAKQPLRNNTSRNEVTKEKVDQKSTGSEVRLHILERYLRPALIPNETWHDVERWHFHSYLLRWARSEILWTKYGEDPLRPIVHAYPHELGYQSPQVASKLRQRAQSPPGLHAIVKLWNRLFADKGKNENVDNFKEATPLHCKLPSSSLIKRVFGVESWATHKDNDATCREMVRIAQNQLQGQVLSLYGGALKIADISSETNLSPLSLEELLEVAGGHVMLCGSLNAFLEHTGIYQLWTREYVSQLGKYLHKRTEEFPGETIVVDVGAGDGLLAQALRDYFEHGPSDEWQTKTVARLYRQTRRGAKRGGVSRSPCSASLGQAFSKVPVVVATDDMSWRIPPEAEVQKLSVHDAIREYKPNDRWQVIVICSWMPMGEDWSAVFRSGQVDEYILIGECDDGQCGDNWETWGNYEFLDGHANEQELKSENGEQGHAINTPPSLPLRPYETDGYQRKELTSLSHHQFSRYDCAVSKSGRTVSFRRSRNA